MYYKNLCKRFLDKKQKNKFNFPKIYFDFNEIFIIYSLIKEFISANVKKNRWKYF